MLLCVVVRASPRALSLCLSPVPRGASTPAGARAQTLSAGVKWCVDGSPTYCQLASYSTRESAT
eukprot:3446283-Alexandrium_andersonii.AAC.1